MFRVKVTKNNISVPEKDQMTCGSVNVYPVQFEFNESDWGELDRVAVFKNQVTIIKRTLDETNLVQMPWELMTFTGSTIQVGVIGMKDGEVVLPTQWGACGTTVEGVIPDGGMIESGGSGPSVDIDLSNIEKDISEIKASLQNLPKPIPSEKLAEILGGGEDNE